MRERDTEKQKRAAALLDLAGAVQRSYTGFLEQKHE
jgi:hypothetical protein